MVLLKGRGGGEGEEGGGEGRREGEGKEEGRRERGKEGRKEENYRPHALRHKNSNKIVANRVQQPTTKNQTPWPGRLVRNSRLNC